MPFAHVLSSIAVGRKRVGFAVRIPYGVLERFEEGDEV
jgi:hypothetical protein